jgi:hypothetical protein
MPVPFMIGMGQDAVARQALSGLVSLTPTAAKAAILVVEDLSSPEITAKRLLAKQTVATTSRIACESSGSARGRHRRRPALRATASR